LTWQQAGVREFSRDRSSARERPSDGRSTAGVDRRRSVRHGVRSARWYDALSGAELTARVLRCFITRGWLWSG